MSDPVYAEQGSDGRWHLPGPAEGSMACGARSSYRPPCRLDATAPDPRCEACFPAESTTGGGR